MTHLLPFFVAIPLLISFLIQIFAKSSKKVADILAFFSALLLMIFSIMLVRYNHSFAYKMGGWSPPIGINLVYDALTGLMLVVISVISFLIVVYSFSYMEKYTEKSKYYSLLLLMIAGMNGIVISGDFFNIYVFLEIASISSYALVGFGCESKELEASFKYLVLGSVASSFILLGIVFVYGKYGTLNLAQISSYFAKGGVQHPFSLNMILTVMFLMGFGLKSAMVPFHSWLPDAHPSAPAPISAMLSGLLIKALGAYCLIRLFSNILIFDLTTSYIFMGMGILSMVTGGLLATGQWDFKRLLAYSSISQLGYVILAFGMGGAALNKGMPQSLVLLCFIGGLFHLMNHAVYKSLLFLCSGAVEYTTGTRKLYKLGGLRERMPVTSFSCFIGSLSISGIPPFNGFWSKLIIIIAAFKCRFYFAAAVAVAVSFITLTYYIKVQKYILFGELKEKFKTIKEVPFAMCSVLLILAILCIGIGFFYPCLKAGLLEPAAKVIMDKSLYLKTVDTVFMK